MLDDQNVLRERDPEHALAIISDQYKQVAWASSVMHADHDHREIRNIVVTGMGGSALAALVIKSWLSHEFSIPFEVVRGYDMPGYVNAHSLVIASSYSGNTEETISAFHQASIRGAQLGAVSSGGSLETIARKHTISFVKMPAGLQPRMALGYNLRGIIHLLVSFGMLPHEKLSELSQLEHWLAQESQQWQGTVSTDQNLAKQIALHTVGKTPVFYGGALSAPVAYKWKISWNETSKNVAFWNEYSEVNHNEFMGWTSHPIEKPFAVIDLISSFEHPEILKRFTLSDRLLSGKRPKALPVHLKGESVLAQLLWGCTLADFSSFYTAVLNGVDPTPVLLIETLKKELK